MEMRWHCPPENSWGRLSRAVSGSTPTESSIRSTMASCSLASEGPQTRRGSATMSPTVRLGFSDEIGSWKIIWMCVRLWRISSSERSARSTPLNVTLPEVGRGNWMIARPLVDLPQPDSPTSPRVSPDLMSKLMPLTAFTVRPRPTGNSTTRSSTVTSTSSPGRRWAFPVPAISHPLHRSATGWSRRQLPPPVAGRPPGSSQRP